MVIAILEDVEGAELTTRVGGLSTTIAYLESSLALVESDAYQLAIITYALQLGQSSQTDAFLAKLEALQIEDGMSIGRPRLAL